MSAPGQTPPAKTDLLSVIKADIMAAEHWLVAEAQSVGVTLWSIFKVAILSLTSKQAQVVVNVLSRLNTDLIAGKTIEQIETDLLNEAMVDEMAIIKDIESKVMQALIAAWKAS